MKADKIKAISTQLLLLTLLVILLFCFNVVSRVLLAAIILVYSLAVTFLLRKKTAESTNRNKILIFLIIFATIFVVFFYLMGLHFGFVKTKIALSFWSLKNVILPLVITIIGSEIIRTRFLSQEIELRIKTKRINLSPILTYVTLVLIDLLVNMQIYDFSQLDDTLLLVGFVLITSLSSNLLLNYTAKRCGEVGNIAYKLITILTFYILPVNPDIHMYLQTVINIVYPYIVYLTLEKVFNKNKFAVSKKTRVRNGAVTVILFSFVILFVMLISCQFKYSMLVISTRSMANVIDRGDAVIYEKYDGQTIDEGQIIVFDYNGMTTVHRVIDIKTVNGVMRYYTKGDANKDADGYVTNKKIYGIVKLKLKYFGYPTLWVRDLFPG